MKILFVAAEAAPLAKVGGMGDVVGSLPAVLRKMGHDVRVLMPYYGFLPGKLEVLEKPVWKGDTMFQEFAIFETLFPGTDVPLYLFGHPVFSDRNNIYYGDDEDWRFTFFASGATEFVWKYWSPDIVHCHDWHAGMIPVWLHETETIKTVFTIHNLAYQGPWRWRLNEITWCPWYMEGHNTLAAAVQFADWVTTVSPTYAQQIQTPAYGETLDGLLSFISGKLTGILNGIDVETYNPETDLYITENFGKDSIGQRQVNKLALQEELGLASSASAFLVSSVTRLVEQKGVDLILQIMDRFLSYTDAQFVLLGTGDRYYESQMWEMSARFPGRVSVQLLHNDGLARRIYSGADAFLMPSRFEPCGLAQLLAMRYGCIPIVRRTGGLVDTVKHHAPVLGEGTGYCFDRYEPLDLFTAMVRAWEGYVNYPDQWRALQQRAMSQNFSWYKSAATYIQLYKRLLGLPETLSPKEQAAMEVDAKWAA